ncbi:hypothetical protein IPZ78_14040 [Sphingobacterium sp. WQ 366]|uniref:Fructose-1-6-bisphosphatase class 1 C-terminal domain-containing protein n=2 Tax=Sphingobacterium bovistauri TaxID=2781959 RepID=A0ABS7Z7V4_9SPHI|nr:hypothetical protein [Sphingobacterium bovistauri]
MAYIFEKAGRLTIDGKRRIVDVPVHNVHQKVPFVAGSYNMVKKVLDHYKNDSINKHVYYSC